MLRKFQIFNPQRRELARETLELCLQEQESDSEEEEEPASRENQMFGPKQSIVVLCLYGVAVLPWGNPGKH